MTDVHKNRWLSRGLIALGVVGIAVLVWLTLRPSGMPAGIVSGNGRIEAVEIDIAAKMPGRIADITVNEGQFVRQGQVVATMDTDALQAQLAQARAQLAQASNAIQISEAQVLQRQSDKAFAQATVRQREAELNVARKRLARSSTLSKEGATPMQERDNDQAAVEGASAAVAAAEAQVAAVDSAIRAARSQVVGAGTNVDATRATIDRIMADINDSVLRAPRAGRIQYRIAQPGEVVAAGGRVLTLIDPSDVTMVFFLPEAVAGRVALGDEARIVLDALPDRYVPARISFVADVAQFTPKSVETSSEREKLMFRVKARIDPDLLRRHLTLVKTGVPGVAYVRIDPNVPWPAKLSNVVKD
ncbi:HlyD family efflux transporter periplasmic adaptor subunit [Sphingomonas sp.]|jgi:HlyD family secretion protein|uniref:HlyD family secretion protein n=1 Tax=Sphingomonas sp. TaxID=28214 RepID=UPI002612838C|nr:HlyD family efflux transporter periplasmic adaptor subunit [Sphingomonas sp.]MDF2493251.1 HlyD family efflux transporter periplasmic adaptor subunit [Sphingomonas sp.]